MRSGTARKHFVEYGWIWQGRYEFLFRRKYENGAEIAAFQFELTGAPVLCHTA
jgi:hypothetical protein